jgi:hypothetical protein
MFHARAQRSFILRQAGLSEACAQTRGDADFRIGLIDGTVNVAHGTFSGCRIDVSHRGAPSVADDHATFGASILVAGVAARQSGAALGLCADCTLINIPAVSDAMLDGTLSVSETARRLAGAVDFAVAAGCSIILFGIAIQRSDHPDWSVLKHALWRAVKANILAIIPAGNGRTLGDDPQAPWSEALFVASTSWRGATSRFSLSLGSRGRQVFAPGEDLPGASGEQDLVVQSGSSGAAAMAAGAVAIGCALQPGRPIFDVTGDLFPPPDHRLNGAACLNTARRRVPEKEQSYGT